MTQSQPEPAAHATVGTLIEAIKPGLIKQATKLSELGKDGALAADGEIRRGLIALNGAGLLAVISLLSQSFDPTKIRISALLYFLGLICACAGWVHSTSSYRGIYSIETTITVMLMKLSEHDIFKKPLTSAEEVDEAGRGLQKALLQYFDRLKKPGTAAVKWTYLSLACFFGATTLLVGMFELAPITAKIKNVGTASTIPLSSIGNGLAAIIASPPTRLLEILGILLASAGAGLLFFFGVPFSPRTRGAMSLLLEKTDESVKAKERLFDLLSWVGLSIGVVGAMLQIWAACRS